MTSKGEQRIIQILQDAHIQFVTEYILGAKGFSQQPLRYDFHGFFHHKEFLIEYQGIEHYTFVPFFHKSRAEFQKRQIYDEKKISYALAQGIQLYCIPYWDLDKLEKVEDLFKKEYLAKTKSHNYSVYEKYQKSLTP